MTLNAISINQYQTAGQESMYQTLKITQKVSSTNYESIKHIRLRASQSHYRQYSTKTYIILQSDMNSLSNLTAVGVLCFQFVHPVVHADVCPVGQP